MAAHYRAGKQQRTGYTARNPAWVDKTGTVRRLRALVRMGWTLAYLSRQLGMHAQRLTSAPNRWVHRDTREKVRALYDELSMLLGPSPQARAIGVWNDYPPPLAWSDEDIDDPKAAPGQFVRSADIRRYALQSQQPARHVAEKYDVSEWVVLQIRRQVGQRRDNKGRRF